MNPEITVDTQFLSITDNTIFAANVVKIEIYPVGNKPLPGTAGDIYINNNLMYTASGLFNFPVVLENQIGFYRECKIEYKKLSGSTLTQVYMIRIHKFKFPPVI